MRSWRVLLAGVLGSAVLLALIYRPTPVPPAEAQGVGIFQRADCTTITAPVAAQSICWDQTLRVWKMYTGASWASVTVFNGVNLIVPTSGPHIIGPENPFQQGIPTPDGNTMFWVTGNFTPSHAGDVEGVSISPALRPNANTSAFGLEVRPSMVVSGSGTHPLITGLEIEHDIQGVATAVTNFDGLTVQQLVATTGTVNASAIRVVASPLGATNGFGLNIGGVGRNKIDGSLTFTDGATGVIGPSVFSNNSLLNFAGGTVGYRWFDNQTTFQRMRLTETGTLIVGTGTTTQGAGVLDVASLTMMNGSGVIVASGTSANLTNIRGISASSSKTNNLSGTCTFAAAVTCAVTFTTNEIDSHYKVMVGGIVTVSAKTVSGFTLTATGTNSNAVDWLLIR